MSRAKLKVPPPPRVWRAFEVAHRLNMSESTFKAKRPALLAAGMPDADELLGGWDGEAVEHWLNRRAGIGTLPADADDDRALLEALDGNR